MRIPDAAVVILVVAKLTGLVDWSWWWVFSPWLFFIALQAFALVVIRLGGGPSPTGRGDDEEGSGPRERRRGAKRK